MSSNIKHPPAQALKLTVIGSGTCVPSPTRGSPSLLIQGEKNFFLIDCGSGTLGRLARLNIGPQHIGTLFLTHFHPDHVSDLTAFLFANNFGQPPRKADLSIIGAPGLAQFIGNLQQVFNQWLAPKNYRLQVIELTKNSVNIQGVDVRHAPVKHTPSSLAYRFTGPKGQSIVISGDTDYCPELITLAREADLLVLECSHPDALKVTGHLSPSFAGKIAKKAGCQHLLLTHFYPPCDNADIVRECRKVFSGKIYLAKDFAEYVV